MPMRKLEYQEQTTKKLPAEEYKKIPRNPIFVVLDNIRSVHNVGAMFRTSDAVLVEKIFLTGYTATPPREDLKKTALVTLNSVPWEYYKDPVPIVKKLKEEGTQIVSLEITDKSLDYTNASYKFPLCLIVGNELTGIREELLELTDLAVQIPMLGKANSLNVATSFGIELFEILRHYNQLKK